MKRNAKRVLMMGIMCLMCSSAAFSQSETQSVMTKEKGGVYSILTESICQTKGYRGMVPLKVGIKKSKIVSVEVMKNHETPKFFQPVEKEMIPKFIGKKLTEIDAVDGITGATFSSKVVKENVRAAAEYYKKHK